MKPIVENISPMQESSFALREFKMAAFTYPWHSHPEYELNYIKTGSGMRYVGSSIQGFAAGDLVFIGPDLPHCWLTESRGHSIVAQFDNSLFGSDFISHNEMAAIRSLMKRSAQGIRFIGTVTEEVRHSMEKMLDLPPFERLLEMMSILNRLAKWKNTELLSSKGFGTIPAGQESDRERLERINTYINVNFKKQIKLEDIAGHVNITPTAFCKYFKSRAQKSFITYLNEYRIGYACRLLKETDFTITRIAFECGFENIANFYRQFRKVTGHTPKGYMAQ